MSRSTLRGVSCVLALICVSMSPAFAVDLPPGFEEDLVASELARPTSMAISPDGRIFIAEKGGRVRVVTPSGTLLPAPFLTVAVTDLGDRGILGIALDPQFLENGFVYINYVTQIRPPGATRPESVLERVSRFTANGDVARVGSEHVLLDGIPSDSLSHCGGALAFGPDGMLFVSTGDASHFHGVDTFALRTQDIDSLNGKILRIDPATGDGLPDNPFFAGPSAIRSKVWCLGFRNPFHIVFQPGTSRLFVNDVGWGAYEEVDAVYPGGNFGWPCWEGLLLRPDYHDAFPDLCDNLTVTSPWFAYDHRDGGGCITGGAFATSTNYPGEYRGDYFFADFAKHTIARCVLTPSGDFSQVLPFGQGDETFFPVDLAEGPDGNLYVLNIATHFVGERGALTRIRWIGGGNHSPVASARATPCCGYAPLDVTLSSAGSYDPDGTPLTVRWDFDDGTTSMLESVPHRFNSNGTHRVALTVSDGTSSRTTITPVTVGSRPPRAVILLPHDGFRYEPGQTVAFAGFARDPDEGPLPNYAAQWSVLLHHNDHVHPLLDAFGPSGSFVTEDHGAVDDDVLFYEIAFTATDSSGLGKSSSVTIYPADNAALGRPATASSWMTFPDFTGVPEDGNDGIVTNGSGQTSGWHSVENSGEREWWQVDLGVPTRVRRISIQSRPDLDEPEARRDFDVLGSNDPDFATGVRVLVSQGSTPFPPFDAWTQALSEAAAFQYIRIQKTVPDTFFDFSEFRVYGEPPAARDLAIESAVVDLDPADEDVDTGVGAMGQAVDVVVTIRNDGTTAIDGAVVRCSLAVPRNGSRLSSLAVSDFDPAPGTQSLAPGAVATVRVPFAAGVLSDCGSYGLVVTHDAASLHAVDGTTGDQSAANDRYLELDAVALDFVTLRSAIAPGSVTIENPATEPVRVDMEAQGLGPAGSRRNLRVYLDVLQDGVVVRPAARVVTVPHVPLDGTARRRLLLQLRTIVPPLESGRAYAVQARLLDADRLVECARAITENTFTIQR
ncbi:MAG: PQQ-dependent sugar dehydrogenase [Planctomycetes bacterium]|nr:PQQ-dependent sugar dehydrogenase [Planctomycetota bacterium]